jgi:hypothetical protein
MSLIFRYQHYRTGRPIVPLGGRSVRPRPVIKATLVGPTASHPVYALLDTGGDDSVFPESYATLIGLDLTGAPSGTGTAVGWARLPLRYGQILLQITDGREHREWSAWVGFTVARLPYPVLGFAGCLQFFDADFRGAREEVELAVNPLYPGT